MLWLKRMNAALDFIESNLKNRIEISEVARIAGCSEYLFTRIFAYITETPLSEYIRRRRLSLAGFRLRQPSVKVIDVATLYGYESASAFARAFQAMHGASPSEAKAGNVRLKFYPRISLDITVKGRVGFDYRIVEDCEHKVLGVTSLSLKSGCAIPKQLVSLSEHGETIHSLMVDKPDGSFDFIVCVQAPWEGLPSDYKSMMIPARTWVVFTYEIMNENPEIIASAWKQTVLAWLPNSGYVIDEEPKQACWYRKEDGAVSVDIWIPIAPMPPK